MKFNYLFVFLILVAAAFFFSAPETKAQDGDTLTVEWLDGGGNFVLDALRTAIESDVNRPAGRVYKLRRGGYYWVTETITNADFTLRIVGETPDPSDPALFPAVLQRAARTDGTTTGNIIRGGSSIELKNVYMINSTSTGVQTDYQPFQIDAVNSRFIFDNVVFERTSFASVAFTAAGNDIFFMNCTFRNQLELPTTQQWAGRGISVWADQDSIVIENCTFFNIGFTAFQQEQGASNYIRFAHNTLVNVGRGMFAAPWLQNAYVADNLIINGYWHGEGIADLTGSGRDPRATQTGMFGFTQLPSQYGTEDVRRVLFTNNATWRDPYFAGRYGDSIAPQYWVNRVLQEDFIDPGDYITVQDTMWLSARPDMPTYFPTSHLDLMWESINSVRTFAAVKPTAFYNLVMDNGDTCYTCPFWPLEDFSYTTASLMTAGFDGRPLGNLNFFPTAKADYEAGKAAYAAALHAELGNRVVTTPIVDVQAEDGTVSGGAVVEPFSGNSWYTLVAGAELQWSFEAPAAGPVDMKIRARADGGNIGINFFLNEKEIHDILGWGQFVFWTGPEQPTNKWSGRSTSQFYDETYTQTDLTTVTGDGTLDVVQGTNTVRLKYNWNPLSVARIEFFERGTTNLITTLNFANAVSVNAQPNGEGVWVPQGFSSVNLGTNGSVAIPVNIEIAGNHIIRVFFQNTGATQPGSILVDGVAASTVDLESEPDSTENDNVSLPFALSTGAHTIALQGSSVKVDHIQVLRWEEFTGVVDRPGVPEGFSLKQNYPNPFNPTTNIDFDLGRPGNVTLAIYDVLGQKVATLINNTMMNAGAYTFKFDARNLASGVYFYSIEAGDFKVQKKMMLLK